MQKVYIIGAVTGLDPEEVRNKFAEAERRLKEMGMSPVNPINFVPEDLAWGAAMRICVKALVDCDAVFLLPDWVSSKGGMLEVTIARNLGLTEYKENIKRSVL